MNLSQIAGMFILFFLIGMLIYASYSAEKLLELKEGEKPSLWLIPGIFIFGSFVAIVTSKSIYRIVVAILM